MGRTRIAEFQLPDEEGFADIIRECKLGPAQQTALRATLGDVAANCKGIGTSPSDRQLKTALKALDKAFDRLRRQLDRQDVTSALGVIETYGTMGYLLSSTAVVGLANDADSEVAAVDVERVLARKHFESTPLRQSDLDALCLVDRQRRLNDQTAEAMRLVVAQMHSPISSWLRLAGRDKGGNRPKMDREWLILLLARDAQKIIGHPSSSAQTSPFFKLCTAVLGACHFDCSGYEDAVERCLKKYNEWLEWHQRRAIDETSKQLNHDDINRIGDDPEPKLTC